MTETTINLVRPDGMMDEQWNEISEALAFHPDSVTYRLGRRSLDQFHTAVTAAEQRQVMVTNHRELVSKFTTQLSVVGEMLLNEAENRDWCSEYDTFVDKVNDRLGDEVLQRRARPWSVEFRVTITTTATDSDMATENAESMLESVLSDGNWDDHSLSHYDTNLG